MGDAETCAVAEAAHRGVDAHRGVCGRARWGHYDQAVKGGIPCSHSLPLSLPHPLFSLPLVSLSVSLFSSLLSFFVCLASLVLLVCSLFRQHIFLCFLLLQRL